MPELPEVEVLRRHLHPVLTGRVIQAVHLHRPKVIAPTSPTQLRRMLHGARFAEVHRRGKYLCFGLRQPDGTRVCLLGHLGMTGRMYLVEKGAPLPKHVAVRLELDQGDFLYEDPRYFGRLTLDESPLAGLGPEPLAAGFTAAYLRAALGGSRQAIKVKLLDQTLVAGVGNIYASEALYEAGISPRRQAGRLKIEEVQHLWRAIRRVLREAIRRGSTIPLDFAGTGKRDGLFYYGSAAGREDFYAERLRVYDKAGKTCLRCQQRIRRIVQAARSTYYCPGCQN